MAKPINGVLLKVLLGALVTVVFGVSGFVFSQQEKHKEEEVKRHPVIMEKIKNQKDDLIEIKDDLKEVKKDVKLILRKMP